MTSDKTGAPEGDRLGRLLNKTMMKNKACSIVLRDLTNDRSVIHWLGTKSLQLTRQSHAYFIVDVH